MADETISVLEIGDRLIQFGCTRKTEVAGRIDYARPFDVPPRVVVTPFWEGGRSEVNHAETLGHVGADHFVVFSNNAAPNYYVSWLAIGYARGGMLSHNVDYLRVDDLLIEAGATSKPDVSATAPLRFRFAESPGVQVSPFWNGHRNGVGHAETLGRVAPDSFAVLSDNRASDYAVNWIAVGTQRADLRPVGPWRFMEYPIGDHLLRTYRIPIASGGVRDFAFETPDPADPSTPPFAAAPTLLVTPFWEGQGRGVGHAETINAVEPYWFSLAGGNGAPNYSVSLIVIGRRR